MKRDRNSLGSPTASPASSQTDFAALNAAIIVQRAWRNKRRGCVVMPCAGTGSMPPADVRTKAPPGGVLVHTSVVMLLASALAVQDAGLQDMVHDVDCSDAVGQTSALALHHTTKVCAPASNRACHACARCIKTAVAR
jgi:hypothetical protein